MQEQGNTPVETVSGGGISTMPQGDSGGSSKKPMILAVLISVVLFAGLMYGYFIPQLVSKADFTKNIADVVNELNAVKDSNTALSTQITNLSNSIGSVSSEVSSVRGSIAGYATQGSLTAMQTSVTTIQGSLATIQADINSVKASVGDIPTLKTKVDGLQTSLDTLNTQFTALKNRVTETEADITALQTKVDNIVADNITTTTGNTTTSGAITVSYFNSPMIFSGVTTNQTRSFGIKIVNGYTDRDLAYVDLTVSMTIANLSNFEINGDPLLKSSNNVLSWNYDGRQGNVAKFTANAWIYVQRNNGEFSDTEKLTLFGDSSLVGTYTVSVNSVVINSKTLQ